MLAGSAWAEVVNHGIECRKRCGAIGPNIRSVGFLLAWLKHLDRGSSAWISLPQRFVIPPYMSTGYTHRVSAADSRNYSRSHPLDFSSLSIALM